MGNGSNGKVKRNFINILFMNKNYLFAAAIMACVCTSCSQDESLNVVGGESLVFTGEMESVGSRTLLSEDNKVLWVEDDEVSIFKGTNTNRRYKVVGLENGKATFDFVSYSTPAEVVKFSGNYSVYPYSDGNAIDANGTISATVGAEYTYTDKASSISSALMVAKSEGTNFSYKNAQGILRLRLNAEMPEDFSKITSIKLTSATQNLNGVAEMSWEGATTPVAVIKNGEDENKSLTINIPNGLVLPAKQDNKYVEVYVPVVPATFAAGDVEMLFTFDDGTTLTSRKNKSEFSIFRKEITGMKYTIGTGEFTGEIEGIVYSVDSNEDLADVNGKSGDAYLSGDINGNDDIEFSGTFYSKGNLNLDMDGNQLTIGQSATITSYAFAVHEGKTVVNDVEISTNGAGFNVKNGASVTFNSGSVKMNRDNNTGNAYMFYAVGDGSTITINDGSFSFPEVGSNVYRKNSYICANENAVVYVKGGEFGAPNQHPKDKRGIVTANGGKVIISGGTFGFDPTEWLGTGYTTIKKNDKWYVVPEGAEEIAEDADALRNALVEGKNVVLLSDVTTTGSESNAYGKTGLNQTSGGVINGNGHTLNVTDATGTWDSAINTTGGTIKNLTVAQGFRGIFVNHNSTHQAKVILENVIIDGPTYTISCDQGTNNGLEAYNCTINGWTSYAATIGNVTFTGCSFGEGAGYAFCRPYAPTAFKDCGFAEGFKIDARAAITFENCTLNGVALTSENLAALVTSNTGNATIK